MDKVNMDNIYYKNTCVQMLVLQLWTTVFKPNMLQNIYFKHILSSNNTNDSCVIFWTILGSKNKIQKHKNWALILNFDWSLLKENRGTSSVLSQCWLRQKWSRVKFYCPAQLCSLGPVEGDSYTIEHFPLVSHC